jgi:transcription-repair coupling factor (superfamily II helicase)
VLADLPTALQRLPPRTFIDAHSLSLAAGEELDLESFRMRLTAAGYASVPQVGTPGEFAIRGSLFDIFPMGSDAPLRIDLDDRRIDSIRSFDSETQRTTGRLDRIELLPAREFSLAPDSIRDFRRRFRTRFEGDLTRMPVYRDVGDGLAPAGIEYFLPLFFESTSTLFDYLPDDAVLVLPENAAGALAAATRAIEERYEEHRYDIEHPVLAPAELFLEPQEWLGRARGRPHVQLGAFDAVADESDSPRSVVAASDAPELRIDLRREDSITRFATALRATESRVLLAAESPGRRELLLDLLRPHGIAPKIVAGWDVFLPSGVELAVPVAPLVSGVVFCVPQLPI